MGSSLSFPAEITVAPTGATRPGDQDLLESSSLSTPSLVASMLMGMGPWSALVWTGLGTGLWEVGILSCLMRKPNSFDRPCGQSIQGAHHRDKLLALEVSEMPLLHTLPDVGGRCEVIMEKVTF